jgi:hypothetical protein
VYGDEGISFSPPIAYKSADEAAKAKGLLLWFMTLDRFDSLSGSLKVNAIEVEL